MSHSNTPDLTLLDRPIWNSLISKHAHLALGADTGHGLARRYPPEIDPLAALHELTPEAYAELAAVTPADDVVVLFLDDKATPPTGWEPVRNGTLVQMICPSIPEIPVTDHPLIPLDPSDYAEMVDLATLTEPGPFRARTAELGGFYGVRVDGRLVAMAGQRLAPNGFTEISAVCTHPEFRGRGYAQALVAQVACDIHADGLMPFLTSFQDNAPAVHVYERLGFSIRRSFELAVLQPPQR